jgi:hypothetical protein
MGGIGDLWKSVFRVFFENSGNQSSSSRRVKQLRRLRAYSERLRHPIPIESATSFRLKAPPDSGGGKPTSWRSVASAG